jgi:hypothetical protein
VRQRWALPQHSSKALCPGWSDPIVAEIEVSQRWAMPQHSCKPLCPCISHLIAAEIEVSQHCAMPKQSNKPLCPVWSDLIVAEIEVSQRWALPQHSCKTLCPGWSDVIAAEIESFSSAAPLRASFQKLLLKRTTAGRRILSTTPLTVFEVLLSMIVLPAAQVLHQSSAGMATRAAAKGASAASSNGCVCVACLVVGVLFSCS